MRAERPRTPCIDCNRYLKFERLFQRARELGCETIVTGHYARIEKQNGRYILKKALDKSKDQSYVLYMLTQEQLAHIRFPLGALSKSEVRRIAEAQGFCNSEKPDSQDICFIPDGDYAAFLEQYTGKPYPTGDVLDLSGHVIGQHRGAVRQSSFFADFICLYDTAPSRCLPVPGMPEAEGLP